MFETLLSKPLTVATPAIHHTIQWIRQWAAVSKEPTALAISDDPAISAAAAQLVKEMVGEIEANEKRPAGELSHEKVRHYIELLSDALEKLSKAQLNTDADHGKAILETLRKEIR